MDTSIDQPGADIRLTEVWDRMGEVCRKLWSEDRVSAVSLQVLLGEFRGEVERAQQTLVSYKKLLSELHKTARQEVELGFQARIATLEAQLSETREHSQNLDKALKGERERAEHLARSLEGQETENLQFKEKYLESEMNRDKVKADQMEEFYKEVLAKSKALEASWDQRRRELDAKYVAEEEDLRKMNAERLENVRKLAMDLEKAHAQKEAELTASFESLRAEMSARESKCLRREEELRQQEGSLVERRKELDAFKARLQDEVAANLRDLQARSKGEDLKGGNLKSL